MTAQPKEKTSMTQAEYLAMERCAIDTKHEYFNGEIFAMVGAKRNHVYINSNLIIALGGRLREGCVLSFTLAKIMPTLKHQ
ncbi:Uma2 family endonuclease [Desulfobacter sp.]